MMVNVHEAKTNLSKLLARVSAGEEVIIMNLDHESAASRNQPWLYNIPQRRLH